MSDEVDVAVVGAGPAGSAAARWLALAGASVALIERSSFEGPRIGESLAPAVQPELAALGVWREFQALEPLPSYGTRSHWGDAIPTVHSHVMNPWGSGWHVNRRAFDLMLAHAAREAGAVMVTDADVAGLRQSRGRWIVTLRRDEAVELSASVVIDATGRAASIAAQAGSDRVVFDQLVGVASMFAGIDTALERYVMVEAAPDGWWYSAPVPGGGLMVMAMTDSDICRSSRLATRDEWISRLEMALATRSRVSRSRQLWGPRVFAAGGHRLVRRELEHRWLAVGDAALAVDPISGSGVLRALRTGRAGAVAALELLGGANSSDVIRAYEADRDRECAAYLNERAWYYGVETRWPASPFWSRRVISASPEPSPSPIPSSRASSSPPA